MTGYVVHYSSNNDVTNSISGLPSSATSRDITDLTNCGTHSISVEATSEQLSGESETMTVCEYCIQTLILYTYILLHIKQHPHVHTHTHTVIPSSAVPEGVSVSDVQPHSVRVSWQAVEGAGTYTVTFTQTMGDEQQGLCTDSHSVSVSTEGSSLSVVVGEDDVLRAFTTYSITVVALSDVCSSNDSQPVTVSTAQTGMRSIIIHHRDVVTVFVLYLLQVLQQF